MCHIWWQQHPRALMAACNPRWEWMLMTGGSSRDLNRTRASLGSGIWCCPTEPTSTPFISFPAEDFRHFCRCNLHYYLPGRSPDCRVLLLALSAFPANGRDGKLEEDLSICALRLGLSSAIRNAPQQHRHIKVNSSGSVAFGQRADQSVPWHINKALIVLFRWRFPCQTQE